MTQDTKDLSDMEGGMVALVAMAVILVFLLIFFCLMPYIREQLRYLDKLYFIRTQILIIHIWQLLHHTSYPWNDSICKFFRRAKYWEDPANDPRWNKDSFQFSPKLTRGNEQILKWSVDRYNIHRVILKSCRKINSLTIWQFEVTWTAATRGWAAPAARVCGAAWEEAGRPTWAGASGTCRGCRGTRTRSPSRSHPSLPTATVSVFRHKNTEIVILWSKETVYPVKSFL